MERRTSIPMVAIAVVTSIPALLALIYIGSPSVFEDVVSLSTSGLYASYFIVCSLLLWRSSTGQIQPYSPDPKDRESHITALANDQASESSDAEVVQPQLMWGPWRLPGILGTINTLYACLYILFVLFWSFWPPSYPATPSTMNYSVLMTGVAIIFSIVYYLILGKKQYKGPLLEREVREFTVRKS